VGSAWPDADQVGVGSLLVKISLIPGYLRTDMLLGENQLENIEMMINRNEN